MKCKSRRVSNYFGIDNAEFTLSDVSCVYDRSQSFKFGSATSCQLAIYNKTIESKANDKFDYVESKWINTTITDDGVCGYRADDDVFRMELRFHHSVIDQFSLGSFEASTGECSLRINSYSQLMDHIQGLWNYGMKSFQLTYNSNYLDPLWSILKNDVKFTLPAPSYTEQIVYKRHYKLVERLEHSYQERILLGYGI